MAQTVVHGQHIFFGRDINDAFNLVCFVVADHIADGRRHDHNLESRNPASVDGRNQLLGYVGRLGKYGMKETNTEILTISVGE